VGQGHLSLGVPDLPVLWLVCFLQLRRRDVLNSHVSGLGKVCVSPCFGDSKALPQQGGAHWLHHDSIHCFAVHQFPLCSLTSLRCPTVGLRSVHGTTAWGPLNSTCTVCFHPMHRKWEWLPTVHAAAALRAVAATMAEKLLCLRSFLLQCQQQAVRSHHSG